MYGEYKLLRILGRFGIIEYKLDETMQQTIIDKAKKESPEKYEELYNETADLIKKYCLQ